MELRPIMLTRIPTFASTKPRWQASADFDHLAREGQGQLKASEALLRLA